MTDINEALAEPYCRANSPRFPTPSAGWVRRRRRSWPSRTGSVLSTPTPTWSRSGWTAHTWWRRGSTTGLRRAGTATCVPSWTGNSRPFIGSFRGGRRRLRRTLQGGKGFHRLALRRWSVWHRFARGHRGPQVLQLRYRTVVVAARRRESLRARTPLQANHVRPRSPQQRCQAAVRVRRFLGEHDMSNGRMALYALRRESK